MSRKLVVILALCLGVTGCHGQQLTRSTAQRIIRENMASGQFGGEIKVRLSGQVLWFEQQWTDLGDSGKVQKLSVQADLSFLNHLLEAGVLRKMPDQYVSCSPEPDCKEHNKTINFSIVPSRDVDVDNQGNGQYEHGTIVWARPSSPTITGITQDGNDATVEFMYGYIPSPFLTRASQQIKDDFAKCSLPELSYMPPSFCIGLVGGNPNPTKLEGFYGEADIAAQKVSGSLKFKRYDDGWRIAKQRQ